jgi:protein-S-isoprenylcysteine O-methyltransferase Ste14
MNKKIKLILLSLLVYGIPIFIFSIIPYTKNLWGGFESSFIFNFLFYGKKIFLPMGIITDFLLFYFLYIILFKKNIDIEKERAYFILSAIKKISAWIFKDKLNKDLFLSKEEKTSLLFFLVKIYFTPVMLNFLINNLHSLINLFPIFKSYLLTKPFIFSENKITGIVFQTILYAILALDTLIFSFGYLFESSGLKNKVRSVEPTVLGWMVAIICYPPINSLSGNILGWYTSDFGEFGNPNLNITMGIVSILFFVIYVWASVALGTKASNLTNRGIVSTGPYKFIRHPAYAAKNLSWWIMGIPFIMEFGFIAVLSLSLWTFIYYLRALTEEKHLLQDPDYIEYCKKVKYMFLPGIF